MQLPKWTTLLVPLGGTSADDGVVTTAERIARAASARVVLVRAIPLVNPATVHDVTSLGLASESQKLVAGEARALLADVAARLRRCGISTPAVVRAGDPAEVILDAARSESADLVIMGTSAPRGFERWLVGSVTDRVARASCSPVLVMPRGSRVSWTGDAAPRILVTLDGSQLAEAAVPPAMALAAALRGEVHLLTVIEPAEPHDGPAAVFAMGSARDRREKAHRALRDVTAGWKSAGVPTHSHVTVGAYAPESIVGFASEHRMDIVAIATHGRGGLLRLALGSVTTEVLGTSTVPVLVVRPDAGRDTKSN